MSSSLERIFRRLPELKPRMIFDVGANVGQTSKALTTLFPDTCVHAFEPVSSTYEKLKTDADASVKCHRLAFGATRDAGIIHASPLSVGNRLVADPGTEDCPTEEVPIVPGDEFCAEHGIREVDFLKIDAEGHDLQVLVGFRTMLAEHRIRLLQVEASMNPENRAHVDLSSFRGFLEPLGYYLFQINEQVLEKRLAIIRRCNAVFISREYATAIGKRRRKAAQSRAGAQGKDQKA